jgi:hypothetical protein
MALDKALTTGAHDYLHLGIGFVVNLALIVVLFRIFNKKY